MSTRRSSRSKPATAAATAADPIHVDSGAATPEATTPPPAHTDPIKKDQQLETSADVLATTDSPADTPATPADTPSAGSEEPEQQHHHHDDEAVTTATSASTSTANGGVHHNKEEEQAKEAAEQPAAISEVVEKAGKDESNKQEGEEIKAGEEEKTPATGEDTKATPVLTPVLNLDDDEAAAGVKRPEPDSKEEAEKESKDYLEGAYKSPFRHSAAGDKNAAPQESS